MTPAERKLVSRLQTIQRKIAEVDTDHIQTEIESLIANANAAIQMAIKELVAFKRGALWKEKSK